MKGTAAGRGEGFTGIVVLLDDEHGVDAYRAAAALPIYVITVLDPNRPSGQDSGPSGYGKVTVSNGYAVSRSVRDVPSRNCPKNSIAVVGANAGSG